MQTSNSGEPTPQTSGSEVGFSVGQRVHSAGDTRRIGTVKYLGPVEGYSGTWVGVDWDNDSEGRHDGSHNGVKYFEARGLKTASFVRPPNLSSGIALLQALEVRYRSASTKEEEDEMYVLSARNNRVAVQLLGKDKIKDKVSRFEELTSASLSYLGVSSPGPSGHVSKTIPNLKELDLTGNLLSNWKDVGIICEELPALEVLNLSCNLLSHDIIGIPQLNSIRILVLNHTGINWKQPASSHKVKGFDFLRLLNLEDNSIADWNEIVKLSHLRSLKQLLLNKNNLNQICYPDCNAHEAANGDESLGRSSRPFKNLQCLLLGGNKIQDLASVDSLNSFPNLMELRLSENPAADPGRDGAPRFVLIARLAKVKILNGSEISARERKESEIRYVRLVMSKSDYNLEKIMQLHPRFAELKMFHGIEDVKPQTGTAGPQKMASGLISITLKCVGASIGEKAPLTKKLPSTTTVGKLKNLCEVFFKLKSVKPKLFLQEEGSPLPTLLDDDMASLVDLGVGNESTILVDEE